jgi:hypothetical protein
MKKLLLLIFTVAGMVSANAQATCATATVITTNGTYTTGTINGTYKVACFNSATGIKGYWYSFTAPSNGEISISSNLASNDGVAKSDDTRVSIATGSCSGTLTCVSGNDDIDADNQDYLSELLNIPVTAGTVYLIEWDSRWSALPLDFTFNFTPVTCTRPTVFYLPEYVSTSSVDLYWDQTTTVPTNYQVDWSTDSLPTSSNFRYFCRANCGATQSTWSGPYYGYLPVTLPYSNDFENEAENYTDGFINFNLITTNGASTPPNYADGGAGTSVYTPNSTTAVSNLRAYFRGVSLQAGEVVTVSFKTRLFTTSTTAPASPMNFDLTVGASQSAAGQTTLVQTFTNSSDAAYTTHTATYTAPAAGIYYFSIFNNSTPGATQTFLFLDTLVMSTNLSTNDFFVDSFSVFPNPTSDVLNISSSNSADITKLSVVDVNGRTVKNLEGGVINQVNVADVNSGVYFVNIESNGGKVTKKFIKQ